MTKKSNHLFLVHTVKHLKHFLYNEAHMSMTGIDELTLQK